MSHSRLLPATVSLDKNECNHRLDRIFQEINRCNARDSAKVGELVDPLDLGSSAARRESSSLSFRTISALWFRKRNPVLECAPLKREQAPVRAWNVRGSNCLFSVHTGQLLCSR